ncbi:putative leucine rich repeat and NACHT domain-containing protein [Planoprotostelium fungivorum]|uniref:Putative leucine rich repeat and NACHT domain-containing protein n=1 Tax=Planoprotostelium fungivorum TaxID=1890364 RepID=A0A2P6N3G0_9EUKA|nr:putative leucine rich repeat and NACHT domain-containing protein [Planoprotostelium fungivorum]
MTESQSAQPTARLDLDPTELIEDYQRGKHPPKTLFLEGCGLCGASLEAILKEAVVHGSDIAILKLGQNKLDASDLLTIWRVFRNVKTLVSIDLVCNWFIYSDLIEHSQSDNLLGSFGAKKLASLLASDAEIQRKLQTKSTSAEQLSTDVQFSLIELNLAGNKISDDGLRDLSSSVQGNKHLASLVLSRNTFGDDSVKSLSDALLGNHALTHLDISENLRVTDVGVKALAQSLLGNHSILDIITERGDEGSCTKLKETSSRNYNLANQFHSAIRKEDIEAVKKYIRLRVSLSSKTEGNSALHWAVSARNNDIVRELLEKHAHTMAINSENLTPAELGRRDDVPQDILATLENGATRVVTEETKKEEEFEDEVRFGGEDNPRDDESDSSSINLEDLDDL